jgi:hypothetical protein
MQGGAPLQGSQPAGSPVLTGAPASATMVTPVQPGSPIQMVQVMVGQSNGSATASLVLGIISFIFFLLGFFTLITFCCSVPMSIIGVVLGHVGYSNSKATGTGGGEAIAGLILNWIQVAIFGILVGLMVLGIGALAAAAGS